MMKILENFIRKVAEYKDVYAIEDRIQTSIKMIKEKALLVQQLLNERQVSE